MFNFSFFLKKNSSFFIKEKIINFKIFLLKPTSHSNYPIC